MRQYSAVTAHPGVLETQLNGWESEAEATFSLLQIGLASFVLYESYIIPWTAR